MDPVLRTERTIYSLRHTAICMRIILSHGKVNIFNLAKNAGTSVEQIERFYARHLPLSAEMAKICRALGSSPSTKSQTAIVVCRSQYEPSLETHRYYRNTTLVRTPRRTGDADLASGHACGRRSR